jgi:phenylalanine-4-hydroxylase
MATKNASEASADEPVVSAYERASLGGDDPRCVPQNLIERPPVGDEIQPPTYLKQDHENWQYLFRRQMSLLEGRASSAFFDGVRILGMTEDSIPSLSVLSRNMYKATGWKIARIPGLLHEADFLKLVSERIFPSTDYIRGVEELDYTPAPDCFHDMFGHMPLLTEPDFADYYQMFGQASLNAVGAQRTMLERLHWFTVEFGLVKAADGYGIFGAGILSSKDEVVHAYEGGATLEKFSTKAVTEQDYDVWHLQPTLFVLDSFEQLVTEFREWAGQQGILK